MPTTVRMNVNVITANPFFRPRRDSTSRDTFNRVAQAVEMSEVPPLSAQYPASQGFITGFNPPPRELVSSSRRRDCIWCIKANYRHNDIRALIWIPLRDYTGGSP
jgi:hypothetical protein